MSPDDVERIFGGQFERFLKQLSGETDTLRTPVEVKVKEENR